MYFDFDVKWRSHRVGGGLRAGERAFSSGSSGRQALNHLSVVRSDPARVRKRVVVGRASVEYSMSWSPAPYPGPSPTLVAPTAQTGRGCRRRKGVQPVTLPRVSVVRGTPERTTGGGDGRGPVPTQQRPVLTVRAHVPGPPPWAVHRGTVETRENVRSLGCGGLP